ncbi:MAG: peptidase, partial [Lysobacterales bacterium]
MNERLKLALALGLASAFGLTACQQQAEEQAVAETATAESAAPATDAVIADQPKTLGSGIDMSGFDTTVRPQDDFFEYVNGKWVAETPFPGDRARWGTFDKLRENAQEDVRA